MAKKYYVRDSYDRWSDVVFIDEDDIEIEDSGRETYEYWDGSQYRELVLTDEYGNIEWYSDDDLDDVVEIDVQTRGTGEAVLYDVPGVGKALIERSFYEPLIGRLYWLPKAIENIEDAYQYIASHYTD